MTTLREALDKGRKAKAAAHQRQAERLSAKYLAKGCTQVTVRGELPRDYLLAAGWTQASSRSRVFGGTSSMSEYDMQYQAAA